MAYPDVILAEPSLQSYWHLNEAAGSAVDQKGAISGTYDASTVRNQPSLLPTYANGCCLCSSPAGAGVTFGDNYDFSGTASFTIEVWTQPTEVDNDDSFLVAKYDSGAPAKGWSIQTFHDSVVYRRFDAGVADSIVAPVLPIGAATHCVFTYDGSNMNVYHNAVLVGGPTASTRSITNHAVALALGRYGGGGSGYSGYADEFAIYNAALPAATVISHYRLGVSIGLSDDPAIGIGGRGAGW